MSLRHFLSFFYWEKAVELEELKIDIKAKNQHFNTLNTHYYSCINEGYRSFVSRKDYFEQRVVNNLFYDLNKEFFISFYAKAKNIYGIRNYSFMSFSLRLMHNAIGLYLLHFSQEYFKNYYSSIDTIHSFYGGNIKFENNDVNFKTQNIYYKNEYLKFRNVLSKHTKNQTNAIVLRLDIENYFDNLPTGTLLNTLKKLSKPSIIQQFIYDETTIKEIQQFYRFVMKNKLGIPQVDNDIISGYLGHLYLTFIDLEIDSLMKIKSYYDYKIIRYMDDLYLIFEPIDINNKGDAKKEAIDILGAVKDLVYNKYGLKINNKTNIYFFKNENEKRNFFQDTKNHSVIKFLETPIDVQDNNKHDDPQTIINDIFQELEKIKDEGVEIELGTNEIEQHTLHKIFDSRVKQLLNKSDNKKKLEQVFQDFNFDFIKVSPLVLTILVTKNESTKQKYTDFLLNKSKISSNDREMILELLKQQEFKDGSLIDKLALDRYFSHILDLYDITDPNVEYPGYFELSIDEINTVIANNTEVIKQMELRVLNELSGDYSVALNHLVNEFQAVCYSLDNKKDQKKYDANSVVSLLEKVNINHEQCIVIRNMFDRRNNNLISHAGEESVRGMAVTEPEYANYKIVVGECLNTLSKTIK